MTARMFAWAWVVFAVQACSGHDDNPGTQTAEEDAWLIEDAIIYDGTGTAGFLGDIRIAGGLIVAIGDLESRPDEHIWLAEGLALAPGFIDPHSHHADEIVPGMAHESVLAQGITTVVGGVDGSSGKPVKDIFTEFEAAPAAFNIAYYGGHNTYRSAVMGEDYRRPATAVEIDSMRALLADDLEAGAIGLSTGIEYEPAIYSVTDEIVALAKDAAAVGGRHSSHIRSEDVMLFEAVEELVDIARLARIPTHYSHMKVAMSAKWGKSEKVIAMLDAARKEGFEITGDIYPYDGWQSTMQILLPERNIDDRAAYEYALSEIATPDTIIFSQYSPDPSVVGKTLAQVSSLAESDPVDVYMEMVQRVVAEEGNESIIGRNISEDDIRTFLSWPHSTITSDGGVDDRHPRGQGAFPRVLRVYVREQGLLTLEQAVAKMTGWTASTLGFEDRGRIALGLAADLTLFDPRNVTDHGNFKNPIQYSTGIEAVWVNGELVWSEDAATKSRPGHVIRRH